MVNKVNLKIIDLSSDLSPNENYSNIMCRKSAPISNVTTTLCVHNLDNDKYVSGAIWNNGVWEYEVIGKF